MKNLRYLSVVFSCMVFTIHSQTLSWNAFPAGSTSYTTGIMTATITSSSPGFQNGTPKYYAGSTVGSGECGITGGLALEHMFGNITNAHSTLSMDFTSGNTTNGLCGNISFQVKDINADESIQTFADWVEVSAVDGNNNPIPVVNITAAGGSNKTITISGNTRIVKGYSNNAYLSRSSTLCDNVTFTVSPPAGTTLKSVTLKYHPDYTPSPSDYYNFTGPKRPAYQYISISSITVNATAGPTGVALTTTPASCDADDGTVVIGTVTGGTSPFQFNFNNSGLSTTTNFGNLAAGSYPVLVQDNNGCTFSTNALVGEAVGPTAIAVTPTNASCGQNDGSVALGNVTGGTAPYQYNFNNLGFSSTTAYSNLSSGSYSLTVEDANGCTFSTAVAIGSSSGPTAIAVAPTNASCGQNNGSVALGNVTGGTAPYQYNFNNLGFSSTTAYSNLSSGSYSLTVEDANGCTFSTAVAISSSSGPTAVAISTVPDVCLQGIGSITLGSVTGGAAPYEFNFNNLGFSVTSNYSNLSAGTYSIVVRDASGCTYTTTGTVGGTSGPSDINSNMTTENCGGGNGSVTLGNVTGGTAPFTYNFNNLGFSSNVDYTNLSAGTYPLVVNDANGCQFVTSVVVSGLNSGPQSVNYAATPSTCDAGGTFEILSVLGGASPYTYSFEGSPVNSTIVDIAAGNYMIEVSDANGCTYQSTMVMPAGTGPETIKIPNVFTPDGDPVNGYWFIPGSCIRELECVVVNRWGEVMATFDDVDDKWDGTFHAEKVAEGNYFYKATVTFWSGSVQDYHGHITVIY